MVGSGIFGIRNINVWQLMLFVKKKYIYIYLKRKNLQEVHASGHNFAKIIQQSLYLSHSHFNSLLVDFQMDLKKMKIVATQNVGNQSKQTSLLNGHW